MNQKAIPTLDDPLKEPRIRPKRCPSCQKPNRPEATKCGVCGYDLDAPLPPVRPMTAAKPASSGGGAKVFVGLVFVLLCAAGGAVAYFGLDRAVAMAESLYKAPAPPPSPKAVAQASARSARQKTIDSVKANAGICFTQFNDLMDTTKRPGADQHALLQAYQVSMRQMNSLPAVSAGCGGEPSPDTQKLELCDAAAQLKTCLSTVLQMERERLRISP